MKKVLVIIVTYNGERWIRDCLKSVDPDSGIYGFVVDNGSTDNTLKIIEEEFPHIEIYRAEKNLGFGQGNNVGLRKAIKEAFDYVYLLNQDAWIDPKDILRMMDINDRNPDFGILSPLHLFKDLQTTDKDFHYAIPKDLTDDLLNRSDEVAELYETDRLIPAAHWMMSTETLKKIGGFSPVFSHFGEDDNLFYRNGYHGMKAGIIPSIKAVHDRGERKPSVEATMKLFNGAIRHNISKPDSKTPVLKIVMGAIRKLRVSPGKTMAIIAKVMKDYPMIRRCRKESRKRGAFL